MMETTDVDGSPVNEDICEDSCSKQNLTVMTEQLVMENVPQQCLLNSVIDDGHPKENVRAQSSQELLENSLCNKVQELRDANGDVSPVDQTIQTEKKAVTDMNFQVNNLAANEKLSIHEKDLSATITKSFESRQLKNSRPLPVFVRGMEVDLLQLSSQVRDCGGYDRTTMWSSISVALGFGQECGPLLKLVYMKYLKLLENYKFVMSNGTKESTGVLVPKAGENGDMHTIDAASSKIKTCEKMPASEKTHIRKQQLATSESLTKMLEWLKQLALNPGDPQTLHGSQTSEWNEASINRWEKMVLKLRVIFAMEEKDLVNKQLQESPKSHPKKRSRQKLGVGKGYAKKARYT